MRLSKVDFPEPDGPTKRELAGRNREFNFRQGGDERFSYVVTPRQFAGVNENIVHESGALLIQQTAHECNGLLTRREARRASLPAPG